MIPIPDRRRSLEELYHAALDLPDDQRAAFLTTACADDGLRRELESLPGLASPGNRLPKNSRSAQSTIEPGAELGPYRVGERIGAGGMGEVYKARDVRLEREVALKVLPANLVGDMERRTRFIREARAASRLNHPNTVTIYDIGEQDGRIFIAMEYVDGKTLDAVVPARGLPAPHVVKYAIPIAAAISKAHAAGIVHRDLKPGNIMIAGDDSVKVLDFGLAKLVQEPSISGRIEDPSEQQTQTLETQVGAFIGTPAFMSPEQAQGRPVDARSDIFSFGAVLYHMASGRRPFTGNSTMEVVGEVLHKEPDPLCDDVPHGLQTIILRCLKKDPERRFQSMADVRVSLEEIREGKPEPSRAAAGAIARTLRARPGIRRAGFALLMASLALAAGWIGSRGLRRRSETPTLRTVRFTITPKQLLRGGDGQIDSEVSVSPDGRHIAYVESQGGQLWVRDIDAEEAHPVPGATGVYQAFWSPDGRFIAYPHGQVCFARPCDLLKIPVEGGTPVLITRLNGGFRRAVWSSDGGTILYAEWPHGLFTVPARGGSPTRIYEHSHLEHPSFLELPGGKMAYLFQTADENGPPPLAHSIYVLVAGESRPRLVCTTSSTNPYPAYSPTGHIIYVDGNGPASVIWALPFSLATLRATGKAFPIAQQGASPMVSRNGTLVYGDVPSSRWQLEWVDRSGATLSSIGEPQQQDEPALSPDGRRLAVLGTDKFDLWVYDLGTGIRTRFVSEFPVDAPVWTPPGDEITYAAMRNGNVDILSKPVGGDGETKLLAGTDLNEAASDWSPNGKFLVYQAGPRRAKRQLFFRERRPDGSFGAPVPLLKASSDQTLPRFSPDGRFVAYVSDESGRNEIYVCEFPGGTNSRQISANGGTLPRWSRNGREIFYTAGRRLYAVSVTTRPAFSSRSPEPLFQLKALPTSYDVSADGKRFVIFDRPANEPPLSIHVVHNWFEDFRGQSGDRAK